MKEAFITKEQAEEISRKYPTPLYIQRGRDPQRGARP